MDKLEGLLFRLGIYKCQEGYDCIWTAMELVEEDETLLRRLMGGLYAATAARCGNTRTRVERNIRAPSPRRGRQIRSISRKSPIERLHSRLRQETFFVCCTSICGSKRWKSKHVRRKRLARVCLKTGLGQPRQGAASASGARAATGWRQDRLAALSVGLCGVVWKMGEICLASRGTWPYNRK